MKKIFNKVLLTLVEKKLVDTSIIFVDGTHIKANANKHKLIKKQVKIVTDKYHKELENEVNEFREENGRDRYPTDTFNDGEGNYKVDIKTGEIIEENESNTKTIVESTTDKESGMFVKGEHERQFAYVDQVACDKHGWILAFDVNPGNMHDSKAFLPFYDNKLLKFKPRIICADAGYNNALIAHHVQSTGCNLLVPYVRPRGKDTTFGKRMFDYYFEIDEYMCPYHKMLIPWNVTKDGYIQYAISKAECGNCSFKKSCIKNYSFKVITRHIFEDCLLKAKYFRLSNEGKEIYKNRKETIERVFAECKEHHGLRFTRYKGVQKNWNFRALLYACLNIKKYANLKQRLAY